MAKVLVVDDEEHIRRYYTAELSNAGYEVSTVDSGHQILKTIDLFQPDVVVLDIKLAECDGLELLQDIRNHYFDLPVILCSAYGIYKKDPKSITADHYVVKSYDLSELKAKIKEVIK